MHRNRFAVRIASLAATLILAPTTAGALDIDEIGLLWLHDRVDGTPIPNPFGVEFEVILAEGSGIDNIEIVTPTGTVDMDETDPNVWELAPSVTQSFSTNTNGVDGLFDVFPNTGTYDVRFMNGAVEVDSYSITFSSGDFDEITDFLDINAPAHLGSFIAGTPVTWSCSDGAPLNGICDGTNMLGDVIDIGTDSDVDSFVDVGTSRTSWTPSGIVAGNDYEFELLLGDYANFDTAELSDDLNDPFRLVAGFENISIVESSAVPEPGTAALLASGLAILAGARRRTR